MRKLEIRDQKRSQGFSVHPLDKTELQKAGINLSDGPLHPQLKRTYQRRDKKKSTKENKDVVPTNVQSTSDQIVTSEDSSSRVLDRYQVNYWK